MLQIDEKATEPLVLKRCYCEGSPHEPGDSVDIRTQYGYGDFKSIKKMGFANPSLNWDEELADLTLIVRAVTGWTFVLPDGEPLPISMATLRLLPEEVGEAILEKANEHFETSRKSGELPNPLGGQSQPSSPESLTASPNRATRRARRSTSKS